MDGFLRRLLLLFLVLMITDLIGSVIIVNIGVRTDIGNVAGWVLSHTGSVVLGLFLSFLLNDLGFILLPGITLWHVTRLIGGRLGRLAVWLRRFYIAVVSIYLVNIWFLIFLAVYYVFW